MSETDRRGFLRGGLKAALAGTGGLLLPMDGRSVFSFPNAAAMPDIPVIARGFTPSAELLELRRLKRRLVELEAVPRPHAYQDHFARHDSERAAVRWFAIMYGEYWPIVQSIVERRAVSWGQCAELAEIAWDQGPEKLRIDGSGCKPNTGGPHSRVDVDDILATLVDRVLTLGGGERFDPRAGGAHV